MDSFDESSFDETAINDVDTARAALRWSLDRIHQLQDDLGTLRETLQDKTSQISYLDTQLKVRSSDLDRLLKERQAEAVVEKETWEKQYQFKLDKLRKKEAEIEERAATIEEKFREKEGELLAQYQRRTEDLRARWAQMESTAWTERQDLIDKGDQIAKKVQGEMLEREAKMRDDFERKRQALEKQYVARTAELEREHRALQEEVKKQEAVFKWAKASWEKDVEKKIAEFRSQREIQQQTLYEKEKELQAHKFRIAQLEKQIETYPKDLGKKDADLDQMRQAVENMNSVVRSLEAEKAGLLVQLGKVRDEHEAELRKKKADFEGLQKSIPARLRETRDEERAAFESEKRNYEEALRVKDEEIRHTERLMKSLEGVIASMEVDKQSLLDRLQKTEKEADRKHDELRFKLQQTEAEWQNRMKTALERETSGLRNELETQTEHLRAALKQRVEERNYYKERAEELQDDLNESRAKEGRVDSIVQDAVEEERKRQQAERERLKDSQRQLNEEHDKERDSMLKLVEEKDRDIQRLVRELERVQFEKRELLDKEKKVLTADVDERMRQMKEALDQKNLDVQQVRAQLDAQRTEMREQILAEQDKLREDLKRREKDYMGEIAKREEEIARLRQRAEDAERQRNEMLDDEKRRFGAEVALKTKRFEQELKLKQAELDEFRSAKEEESAKLKAQMAALQATLEGLRLKHQEDLGRISAEHAKEIEWLRRQQSESDRDYTKRLDVSMGEERTRFQEAMRRRDEELERLRAVIDDVNREKSDLLREEKTRLRQLAKDFEDSQVALTEKESELGRMKADLSAMEAERRGLMERERGLRESYEKKLEEILTRQTEESLRRREMDMQDLKASLTRAEAEKQALVDRERHLREHFETRLGEMLGAASQKALLEKDEELFAQDLRMQERDKEIRDLRRQIEALRGDKENLLEREKGLIQHYEEKRDEVLARERHLREQYAKKAEDQVIAQLREQLTERQTELDGMKREILGLGKEKEAMLDAERKLRENYGKRMSEFLFEHTQESLRRKDEEVEGLRKRIDELGEEKTDLLETLKKFRAELKGKPLRMELVQTQELLDKREKELNEKLQELRAASAERDELAKRNAALKDEREKRILTDLEDLVFGVAHQMRNPLGVMRSVAESVLEKTRPGSDVHEAMAAILRSSDTMSARLDEIVDFAKPIDLDLRPASLEKVVDGALAGHEARFAQQKIAVERAYGKDVPPLRIDRDRLEEALTQVVLNAVEAMAGGGTLKVELARDGGDAVIRVGDTGSGIAAQRLGMVFQPFFSTKPAGIGLGLSIAKRVVRLHRGSIEIESELGKGTTLTIRLPLAD